MTDDERDLTQAELQGAEKVNRLVYDYARNKTWTRLHRAVSRGVINAHQAEILMGMWYEDSPYEPIDVPPPPKGPHE